LHGERPLIISALHFSGAETGLIGIYTKIANANH
jgi:hypothetical protein